MVIPQISASALTAKKDSFPPTCASACRQLQPTVPPQCDFLHCPLRGQALESPAQKTQEKPREWFLQG